MNCHLQASTSAKQGKHRRTHDEMYKILLPRYAPYKEGPQIRGNGRAMQDAPEDKAQGPCVSLPEEAEPRNLHLAVGRPPGLAEPGGRPTPRCKFFGSASSGRLTRGP